MSALKGNISTLNDLRAKLRSLPRTVAQVVAPRAAVAMTELAREAFANGNTVYGEDRKRGVGGDELTLKLTHLTESTLRFESAGSTVRCVLDSRYAKYLIGKYRILPMGGLPVPWSQRLSTIVHEVKP
jgi:hypothetical protein